ncbi:MAG: cytochrome c biogenesis protein CcdA, partial [Synechococcaceae cyanobacterium RM1_1_27]|nr:cytochrome c biogenesis protein CcdA [Synechococcaceae cyanobacterium RM1_1_27]
MLESWQLWLYHLEQWATHLVENQLQQLSWASVAVIGVAGLLTSLSPCMLSMLPITVGYIGGYGTSSADQEPSRAWIQSSLFALGVAITLTGLGLGSALLGQVYGQQAGGIWPLLMGSLAVVMGLNLLQLLPIRFPDLASRLPIPEQWPQGIRSLALGLTFWAGGLP